MEDAVKKEALEGMMLYVIDTERYQFKILTDAPSMDVEDAVRQFGEEAVDDETYYKLIVPGMISILEDKGYVGREIALEDIIWGRG